MAERKDTTVELKELLLCAAAKIEAHPELHCQGSYTKWEENIETGDTYPTNIHCSVGWMQECLKEKDPAMRNPDIKIANIVWRMLDDAGLSESDVLNYNDEHSRESTISYLRQYAERA